jgi:predicted component of type VI protein secretion system
MTKLVFIGEKFPGRIYEIAAHRTTVGRADHNTLSLHDNSVSERHCEIFDNGVDLIIHDLGSRNGTVVNGEHLRNAQRPLAHGQIVKFGAVEARLEILPSTEDETLTDVTAVHFHARQITQPHRPPQPAGPATLDAGIESGSNDQTLLLPRPAQNAPPIPPAPPAQPQPSRIKNVVIGIVFVGLALLVWLIFRR